MTIPCGINNFTMLVGLLGETHGYICEWARYGASTRFIDTQ